MARSATLDQVAETLKSAAGTASTKARRAARAATSDGVKAGAKAGAKAARDLRSAQRSVFDEIAEEAERRIAQGERQAGRVGRAVVREVSARPGLAVAAVAATAIAASLVGWLLSRRD